MAKKEISRKVFLRKVGPDQYIRVVETNGVPKDISGVLSREMAVAWLLAEAIPGVYRKIQRMVKSADREFDLRQDDSFDLAVREEVGEESAELRVEHMLKEDDQPDTVTEDPPVIEP